MPLYERINCIKGEKIMFELYIIGTVGVSSLVVYGLVSLANFIEGRANERDKFRLM